MAFGNRKAKTSRDDDREGSGSKRTSNSQGRSGGYKKKTSGYKKKGEGEWVNLGSITPSKKFEDDENYQDICEALKGSEYRLQVKVYLPKDMDSLALRSGDFIQLSFITFDKDPDFVLGHASMNLG